MEADTPSKAWTQLAHKILVGGQMLEEQMGLLIPVYLICVQKPATKNEKTNLLFLDAVSVLFSPRYS